MSATNFLKNIPIEFCVEYVRFTDGKHARDLRTPLLTCIYIKAHNWANYE